MLRHRSRAILWLLGVLLLAAALPASAAAAIRSGAADDPVGDAADPSLDLVQVAATYDEAGALSVTASFSSGLPQDDGSGGPALEATFTDDVGGCSPQTTTFAGLAGDVSSTQGVVLVTPVDDGTAGARTMSADRRQLTFQGAGPGLGGKDLRCVSVRVRSGTAVIDALDAPLRLQGGGPLSPQPPAAPPVVPVPSAPPMATAAPSASFRLRPEVLSGHARDLLRSGLGVRPGCSERCRVAVDVSVSGAVARRAGLIPRRSHRARVTVAATKRSGVTPGRTLAVPFTARARRLLLRQRRTALTVEVRAVGSQGKLTRRVRFTLRR